MFRVNNKDTKQYKDIHFLTLEKFIMSAGNTSRNEYLATITH